ncbi:MAG: ABC transporter ATP-binding protein [Bacillota bacterium]|jgi:ATP-binding cassette subfamily B protein
MSAREAGRIDLRKAWAYTLRAFGIVRERYPGYLLLSGLGSSIRAIQPLSVLYLSARILNELAGQRDVRTIALYVSISVTLTFLLSVCRSAIERRLSVIRSTFLQKMYFFHSEKYMRLDFGHVDKSRTNEMLADIEAKINGNGLGIPEIYYRFPGLVQRLVGLLASCVLLTGLFNTAARYTESFVTSPAATVALIALVLLTMVLAFRLRQKEQVVLKEAFEKNPKANTVFSYYYKYVIEAAKDIRLYGQQPAIRAIIDEWVNASMWHEFFHYEGKFGAATAAANALAAGGVYLFIGLRALAGMYGIGSVLQYIGAVSNIVEHLTALINECASLLANSQYLELAYQYLDLPDDRHRGTLTTEKRSDNEYEIEFRNVSFMYPDTDTYALRNLSLKFTVGRRLAVVGMNGSGKTTMIKLLCRLYDPTEGEITLNGIDIRKYDYQEYMRLFSVVFQDFKLFALPLGQNVAASTEVDADRAEECLVKSGFSERLRELPLGLDTCLYKDFDADGVSISGGEAQKIALARALYKDAPFIVLDEPTAALDPIAEFEVYSRFNEIIEDKTTVFISHRLSSCRFCDDIAVFHEGRLVQRGSHQQLLADKDGKYAELWNAQAQYYVAAEVR